MRFEFNFHNIIGFASVHELTEIYIFNVFDTLYFVP